MKNGKQYDKILSPKEINEIDNLELRELRNEYWKKRHDAFLDDSIPENDLDNVINSLFNEEQLRIIEFRKKIGDL